MPDTDTFSLPAFDTVTELLIDNELSVSAAEAHGLLSGLLCGDAELSSTNWLDRAMAEKGVTEGLPHADKVQLQSLFTGSQRQLQESLTFMLLLPNDNAPLADRIAAVGQWRQGFLSGLGLSGITEAQFNDQDCKEALSDITAIAKIGGEVEDNEDSEKGYAEIIEYLRVAVMLIWQTLNPLSIDDTATEDFSNDKTTLH